MKKLIIFIFLIQYAGNLVASVGDVVDIRSYFKSFSLLYSFKDNLLPDDSPEGPYIVQQNVFRVSLISDPAEWITIEGAYSLAPTTNQVPGGSASLFAPSVDKYRLYDFDDNIIERGQFYLGHNIDRLNFTINTQVADIILGRQVVSFGSARFFNPTDIFSPFSFQELNKEEKTGVDAVRVRVPLGSMSELDMGYVFGKEADWKKSAAFLRGVFPVLDYDVSVMAIQYRTHLMAGLNVSGSIKGAGVWLEGAYTFDSMLDKWDKDGDFFRISTGFDYYFANDVYLFFEYHYSSAGTLSSSKYLTNVMSNRAAYGDSGVYLLGEHYVAPGMNWQLHPLVGLNLQLLINCADPSVMSIAAMKFSLSDNINLDAGATLSFGKKPQKGDVVPELHSEFGTYPHFFYINLSAYF